MEIKYNGLSLRFEKKEGSHPYTYAVYDGHRLIDGAESKTLKELLKDIGILYKLSEKEIIKIIKFFRGDSY